jgi:hypothetical protein
MRKKIFGIGGENMKRITIKNFGAKLRLRGKSSGFIERDTGKESDEPLQLCLSVSIDEPDVRQKDCLEKLEQGIISYQQAKLDVDRLLRHLYQKYYKITGIEIKSEYYEHRNNAKIIAAVGEIKKMIQHIPKQFSLLSALSAASASQAPQQNNMMRNSPTSNNNSRTSPSSNTNANHSSPKSSSMNNMNIPSGMRTVPSSNANANLSKVAGMRTVPSSNANANKTIVNPPAGMRPIQQTNNNAPLRYVPPSKRDEQWRNQQTSQQQQHQNQQNTKQKQKQKLKGEGEEEEKREGRELGIRSTKFRSRHTKNSNKK